MSTHPSCLAWGIDFQPPRGRYSVTRHGSRRMLANKVWMDCRGDPLPILKIRGPQIVQCTKLVGFIRRELKRDDETAIALALSVAPLAIAMGPASCCRYCGRPSGQRSSPHPVFLPPARAAARAARAFFEALPLPGFPAGSRTARSVFAAATLAVGAASTLPAIDARTRRGSTAAGSTPSSAKARRSSSLREGRPHRRRGDSGVKDDLSTIELRARTH